MNPTEQTWSETCEGCGTHENVVKRCVGGSYEGNAYDYWCETCLEEDEEENNKQKEPPKWIGGEDALIASLRIANPIAKDGVFLLKCYYTTTDKPMNLMDILKYYDQREKNEAAVPLCSNHRKCKGDARVCECA